MEDELFASAAAFLLLSCADSIKRLYIITLNLLKNYENYIPPSFCSFAVKQSPFWFATAERGISVLWQNFELIEITLSKSNLNYS